MLGKRILPAVLALSLLAGCSGVSGTSDPDKLNVVCTIFPQYDWAREIIGDTQSVELTLLVDNGMDFHSYQPGTDDMVRISSCDVLIHVGGASDAWVQDSLKNAQNPDMQVIDLTEILGEAVIDEACTLEGHDHDHGHEHEEENTYDEHVWLSVKNAELFCGAITDALCSADPLNAQAYKANADAYTQKLADLDARYEETVTGADYPKAIFADRFPFVYLMEDYDIEYHAAFAGCSSETDVSFETVIELAEAVDRAGVMGVFTIEDSDSSIADAVLSNTKAGKGEVYTLNSMQSVRREDINSGCTYLSIMEENLSEIRRAMYIYE